MKKGMCTQFNGIGLAEDAKCCDAGVNYRDLVGGPDLGWATRLPCLKKNKSTVVCEKYLEPTAAELADHAAVMAAATERMRLTLPLIKRIKEENEGKAVAGVAECPVCGKMLRWTHAASNGHVWGRCVTEGCLAWME